MQVSIPIDAEAALAEDIAEYWQHPAYPTPLPDDFADDLPCALVTEVGGHGETMVTDEHDLSIDVYAGTYAEAMDEARKVAAIVASIWHAAPSSGRQWLTSGINAMPYANPDPSNFSVPRVSITVIATIRGTIVNL